MHGQCVVAEYSSRAAAREGLLVLEKEGFTADSVSVVYGEHDERLEELGESQQDEATGDDAGKSAGLGALLGGAVATPVAISTAIIPLFLAGPLAGMAAGAAVGGLLGGARHWGINEEASKTYQQRVEEGAVLVLVNGDDVQLDKAERSLQTTDPRSLERFASSDHEPA